MLKILIALKDGPGRYAAFLDGYDVDVFRFDGPVGAQVAARAYDLVILEDGLEDGYEGCIEAVKAVDPRVDVIVIGDREDAEIEAIKNGAAAYLTRPFGIEKLKEAVDKTAEFARMRREMAELEKEILEKYTFAGVVGRNPQMLDIFHFLRRIAPFYKTVTIMGETGSGKEEIAKALHAISPYAKNPFIPLNCGGLAWQLIESEFFGHKKGAFTGAVSDKAGIFEAAGEGAVFLDEIGDLPLTFQPHLLRVLQDGEFRRVGSNTPLKARCKVIAATNRDLSREVAAGRFREDLYFRLTPLTINLPPLRERKDDMPLLCRFILKKFCKRTGRNITGISRPAQTALMSYHWQGNVRELESVIEQTAMLCPATFIRLEDLPKNICSGTREKAFEIQSLEDHERAYVEKALDGCGGNRSQAARMLGISRRALQRRLEKYRNKACDPAAH